MENETALVVELTKGMSWSVSAVGDLVESSRVPDEETEVQRSEKDEPKDTARNHCTGARMHISECPLFLFPATVNTKHKISDFREL